MQRIDPLRKKNAKNSPSKGEKNQNFKEFTITRVLFLSFSPPKNLKKVKLAKISPLKGKNCKEFTLKGENCKEFIPNTSKMQRIHPWRVKIAKNSPLKGKKCKNFTLKRWKNPKNSCLKGKTCKEFTLPGENCHEFILKR